MMNIFTIPHKDIAPNDVWNLYFQGECSKIINNTNNATVSLSNKNEVFLFQCMFRNCLASIINLTKDYAHIMHSECFFESCSSDIGPAVRINHNDCSIVQHRFCSHNCSASSEAHHSFCSLRSEGLNFVDESSACGCGNSRSPILFWNNLGFMRFSSTNISKNIGSQDVALFAVSKKFEKLNYTTIESNNASDTKIICLSNGQKYQIENCNILKNYQESSSGGVIFIFGQLTLNNCSIFGDLGQGKIFYCDDFAYVVINNSFYDNLTSFWNHPINIAENNLQTSNYSDFNYNYGYLCDLYSNKFNPNQKDNNIKCSMIGCSSRTDFIGKLFVVLIIKR